MIKINQPHSMEETLAADRVRPSDGDAAEGRSIVELIRELRDESAALMRQEIQLAKVEAQEKAWCFMRNVGILALGGAVAYAGLLALIAGAAYGLYAALIQLNLDADVALWLAPSAVGLIVIGIGGAFLFKAIDTLRNEPLTPERTVQSLKESKQWFTAKLQ